MSRKEETRKRILKVAFELFSSKGFEKTTTREIAAKASVNELTLFRHFETKHNLFQTAVKVYTYEHDIENKLKENLTGKIEDDIRLIGKYYLQFLNNNLGIYKIQLQQADDVTVKFTNSIAYRDSVIDYLEKNYTHLKSEYNFTQIIIELLSFIMGVFNFNVLSKPMLKDFTVETLVDDYINTTISKFKGL